jgi:predicted CXXCH cytochrome family protein
VRGPIAGAASVAAAALAAAAALLAAAPAARAEDSCATCHAGLKEPRLADPAHRVTAEDVHFKRGFSCVSCHGGDGSVAEKEKSHDPARGWVGAPKGKAIIDVCGKCHSEAGASFMKNFNPAMRVDQVTLYRESSHGKKVLAGDEKPATCASCHGNHGVLPVKDPKSPVYPSNVPATCGKCHGDAKYMEGRKIPTDILEKYRSSVHGRKLLEEGDLAAPACNSCHGNHGAAPPDVKSVANVCGNCHVQQADLFRASSKRAVFDADGTPECVICHSNHDIRHPGDEMLGSGPKSVCLQCHGDADDVGRITADKWEKGFRDLVGKMEDAHRVLEHAERKGMEVAEPQFRMNEARDALNEARVLIHGFAPNGAVLPKIAEGARIADQARGDGEEALSEIDFRRRGLYASLVGIALLAAGLWLKIRDLDRRLPSAAAPGGAEAEGPPRAAS